MKVDMTQTLITIDGKPLTDADDKAVTLQTVCINALLATLDVDKNLSGEDKMAAHTLATRIHGEAEPNLEPEDLTKLKERIGKMYGPAVVGPAYAILNGG